MNKEQTIPRLELLSIFIGLSLAESTIQKVNIEFKQINLFCDSTIALCWIQGTKRLPSIVTTLVQKIGLISKRLEESCNVSLFHVPTQENVADCATRGVTKENFVNHRWWCGPDWLNMPTNKWPVTKAENLYDTNTSSDELCSYTANIIPRTAVWPTEKMSNYSKLIRVVAYCTRFIRRASKGKYLPLRRNELESRTTTAEEAIQAEKLIIRQEQALHNSRVLMENRQLNVQADNDDIFRKFGRLENSELSFSAANPIHIPKQSNLGCLIASHLHRSLSHCGSNQLLYNIRQRFWIPQDRALCKRILKHCVTCRKFNAAPFKYPNMGPLPSERVTRSPPFAHTGVDFMGPITIKSVAGEDSKRYVALFTCLVTRLVHLEVATDFSAKSFIFTFKRFIARRGVPIKMLSDNGSNFRLTEVLLNQNCDNKDEDPHLSLFLAEHRIVWNFIPPSSPWMGGVWERMVGTVKRSLQKTIGRRKLTDELLHTTLCEVESVVNSRPLTMIGDHSSPCEALRPIDFIYKDVRHGTTQLSSDDHEDPDFQPLPELSSQKAAKQAISASEKLTKKFWSIWRNEYLMELRDRHKLIGKKTRSSDQQPSIGDVVLLDDDSQQPRGQWPMAVITDLIKSRDGEIRSAMLHTASGRILQRPLNRLIPLEIHASTKLSEGSTNEPSTTEEANTVRRKPSNRYGPEDGVALRQQPPRAAKNNVSYSETKKGSTSQAVSSAVIITAMCIFTLFGSASAAAISCSDKGATLNATLSTDAELCINYKQCTTIPAGANITEIALPFKYLVSQHTIQWRTIVDSKQYTETIICPPGEICQMISCILRSELLGNPHCAPRMVTGILAMCLAVLFAPISLLLYLAARQSYFKLCCLRRFGGKPKRNRTQQDMESRTMISLSTLPTSSKMIIFTAIFACITPITESCQYTHTLSANSTVCSRSSYQTDCREVLESTITLSENRPQACFRLRNKNQTVGSMEVHLQHVLLTCNPVVLFYTRDVRIITESVKRCHLAGSCTSQSCTHIGSRSEIPELHDTYKFRGITRCTTSCGGIGCGCLLPMPGCLFSRSYAKPKNDKIYQVFHCPTWQESALVKFTYTGARGIAVSDTMTINTQATHVMKEANITLEFVTTPAIPLLGTMFIGTVNVSHSEAAVIEKEDFIALRCPTIDSASNISECYVEDRCSCFPSETEAKCVTKAALDMASRCLAKELGQYGIRVNTVNPTVVMTEMGKMAWSDPKKAAPMLAQIPVGRFAEVGDVVGAVLFLLSDASAMTTGASLPVDGGFTRT